jgi:RNA polymerase sigma-70 factor (ECF subfamily)
MNQTRTFMDMVREHDRELRALAYRLLRDRDAMDDVLQEAYLKAFRGYSSFRGDALAGTWLYRIVYNACIDHLRKERRTFGLSLESKSYLEEDDEAQAAGDPAQTVADRYGLAQTLALLPVEQRAAVWLVDATGFSYDQAAKVLGVPAGTVASRLNHAREALRETLLQGREHETVR